MLLWAKRLETEYKSRPRHLLGKHSETVCDCLPALPMSAKSRRAYDQLQGLPAGSTSTIFKDILT